MQRKIHFPNVVLIGLYTSLLFLAGHKTQAQLRLDLESGLVLGTPYNEIRIPNQGGTYVNLPDNLTAKPTVFYRARLSYTIANRHTLSLLYAPLTVRYKGELSQDVNFNNQLFAANRPLNVDYTFNSYRLTYRYEFINREKWQAGVGLTAKIRDANVQFANESIRTNFPNLGFVPLVNVNVVYKPDEHWRLWLEGDALGSRFGRAEDIFLGGAYAINQTVGIKAGYRVVEGGADVDEVYNFTWINYASVGLLLSL
ncbi:MULTISPECIES: hypothetical protein [unclassified Spirosoma]|uniref:hypothetical protein n=1 Tax=unclassified Spirosoma TaxID=2621999 RepID=UPI00095B88EE|nr:MULTISPECIES: hypothetical protein [unclassified Spirosoma]MBN8822929.1 hypothetical protein [Spirosoma sp.]OJW80114.1 MAG: hypothetical protein BGO59_02610 [Spirosoma sp. 48-14]